VQDTSREEVKTTDLKTDFLGFKTLFFYFFRKKGCNINFEGFFTVWDIFFSCAFCFLRWLVYWRYPAFFGVMFFLVELYFLNFVLFLPVLCSHFDLKYTLMNYKEF